jgi:hypothetical protein
VYVASRGTLLLAGVLFSLVGGALLTWTIFRGLRSWRARRANGPVARAEPLPRGVRPTKSLRGEPLLEGPPLRYYEEMLFILYGIFGLLFVDAGVYLLLGAFGVVGPLYTSTP